MVFQPFKPPLLKRKPSQSLNSPNSRDNLDGRESKRQRISDAFDTRPPSPEATIGPKSTTLKNFIPPRKPLEIIRNETWLKQDRTEADSGAPEGYYAVLWRKFTTKKHKTWDGDGVLSVRDGYARLQDVDGRDLGKLMFNKPLFPGDIFSIGGKDVEIDSLISKASYLAGQPFLGGKLPPKPVKEPPRQMTEKLSNERQEDEADVEEILQRTAPQPCKRVVSSFRKPLVARRASTGHLDNPEPIPRHDPYAPDALVMKRPASAPKGKQVVDVVVDPFIARHLRDHQRTGIQFLYECVMGMRCPEGDGAILADDMGLGKTLQTIALLWTLLKQNPIYEDPPVVKKALIVCPVSLINNWRKEFRKWLGLDRIGVFIAEDKKTKTRLTDFTKGKIYSVMIIGYEKLRTVQGDLKDAGIDIVIADEGHRLKTAQNKSALAIKSLNTNRRVILSGTPMQNDLSEFFTMVDFVNPNLLGKYNAFKREFETPILKSRQPGATQKDIEKGEARNERLTTVTGQFILRRSKDVIAKYLPPKTETVLFCRPTALQGAIYRAVLKSPVFTAMIGSTEAALQLITILKKLCNSPSLLINANADDRSQSEPIQSLLASLPPELLKFSPAASAKLRVLDNLLNHLHQETDEKIVIVSSYTSTLDMIGNLLNSQDYPFVRLDGQTPVTKRQQVVDTFNRSSSTNYFAFLLSAKAGGLGLNLVGASRLVLFDTDWNPATDLQAMARIHRDGQNKPCYIYRLLVQGALDEKIYQRQLTKTGLADAVVDAKKTAQGFTREELRDLFRLEEGDVCQTHMLLGCDCGGNGNAQALAAALEEPSFGSTMDDPAADGQSEDDLPAIGKLLSAADVDMEAQERAIKKRNRKRNGDGEEKMLALMHYVHIDVAKIQEEEDGDVESLIEDAVLLNVLKEQDNRVSYVFAKTTG